MTSRLAALLATARERLRAPWHSAFYFIIGHAMATVVAIVGRYQVTGKEHVPRGGPLIVVANHLNNADPPLLGGAIPRRLRFMAKQELFDSRFGFVMRWYDAFPVRRFEADMAALRQAGLILKEGGALTMFPEGHRSHGEGMGEAFPGTALIALRSGATLLPVAITGTERITSLKVLIQHLRIRVAIGEPFTLPPAERIGKEQVQAGTEEIMRRIAVLLPPSYRGVYGAGRVPGSARMPRVVGEEG